MFQPVGRNRYYHRNLNPKKLYDIGFSRLPKHLTLAMAEKLYRLPNQPELKVRALEEKDCEVVCKELNKHQEQFKLVQVVRCFINKCIHIFISHTALIYYIILLLSYLTWHKEYSHSPFIYIFFFIFFFIF